MGIFSLNLNYKNRENQLIFALYVAFELWALGCACMTYSTSFHEALSWSYIMLAGKVFFLVTTLHFVLLYVDSPFLKNKRWVLYILPAFIYLGFVFFGTPEFVVVQTAYGYGNRNIPFRELGFFDHLFRFYWVGVAISIVTILYRHYKSRKGFGNETQVKNTLIAFSVYIAVVLIHYLYLFLGEDFPDFTVIGMIITTLVLSVNSVKYKFLWKKKEFSIRQIERSSGMSRIFSNRSSLNFWQRFIQFFDYSLDKEQVFKYSKLVQNLLLPHVIVAMFNSFFVVSFYYYRRPIRFLYLILILFIGLALYYFNMIKIEEKKRLLITNMLSVLSLVIVTIGFIDVNIRYVWVLGFILLSVMMTALRQITIYTLILAIILSELAVSFFSPTTIYKVNSLVYVLRMLLMGILCVVDVQIQKEIKNDYEVGKNNIKFQEMMIQLSKQEPGEVYGSKKMIHRVLTLSAEYLGAETYYIIETEEDTAQYRNLSTRKGKPVVEESKRRAIMSLLQPEEFIYVSSIKELPLRDQWKMKTVFGEDILSIIVIPIYMKDRLASVFCYQSAEKEMKVVINDIIYTIANTVTSIYEKMRMEDTMYRYAYFDNETQLFNRNMIENKLREKLADSLSPEVAVIFVDCKSYKKIMGGQGTRIQREMMQHIGKRIEECVLEESVVARFGGDKFIVLVNNVTKLDQQIERIEEAFNQPFSIAENTVTLPVTMGVSVYPQGGEDVNSLIKNADLALYKANTLGNVKVQYYSDELSAEFDYKALITSHLYKAMDKKELELFYQPQVDTRTGQVVGAEALLRWIHPEKGMISPGVFIPIAEETGLINSIGEWVVRDAARQLERWRKKYGCNLVIAVNVSSHQLQDRNLTNKIKAIIDKVDIPPELLEVEITESERLSMENNFAIDTMNKLSEIGMPLAIDDFGTRFSSLERLRYLPVTKLKIDMQFIRAINTGEKHNGLVLSIISLGKNLGLKVLAEGVETVEQYEFLRSSGCDEIQGYYFYKPLPANDFEELLKKQGGE